MSSTEQMEYIADAQAHVLQCEQAYQAARAGTDMNARIQARIDLYYARNTLMSVSR